VELHGIEGMPQYQLHTLPHVALPGILPLRVIAKIRAVEHSANDLAQGEDTDHGAVGEPTDQEALDIRLVAATHPLDERTPISGWHHPASMECPAGAVQCDDRWPVVVRRLAQKDVFTDFERAGRLNRPVTAWRLAGVRLRHGEPSDGAPR
jgi:hypothetical protein